LFILVVLIFLYLTK